MLALTHWDRNDQGWGRMWHAKEIHSLGSIFRKTATTTSTYIWAPKERISSTAGSSSSNDVSARAAKPTRGTFLAALKIKEDELQDEREIGPLCIVEVAQALGKLRLFFFQQALDKLRNKELPAQFVCGGERQRVSSIEENAKGNARHGRRKGQLQGAFKGKIDEYLRC